MELSRRKREILGAIINTYIETGEPVGSKMLATLLNTGLSSATLRNEMSELCEMGYLKQPHTSAGRTPTGDGIRFYLSKLMPALPPTPQMQRSMDRTVEQLPCNTELLIPAAAQALSELTGLPTVSAVVAHPNAQILAASVARIGSNTLLLSVLTSGGISGSRICKTVWPLTDEQIFRFNRIVEEEIKGKPLDAFTAVSMQTISIAAGADGLLLSPVLGCLFELATELTRARLSVRGAENLYGYSEFMQDIAELLRLSGKQDALIGLLGKTDTPVSVILGEDSGIPALRASSIVLAGYPICGSRIGRIGVIGPIRLNYPQLIPGIEYFSAALAKKLSAVFESEE